jgi:hypothetical protein
MKIKVACFAATLLLVPVQAQAQELDAASDAGASLTDAQLDAEPDAPSADDATATLDAGVAGAGFDAGAAELDAESASDGGGGTDAGPDGSAGNSDGGSHDGGGVVGDAGPPPPIHNFFNESPGCSLGRAPDVAFGAVVESAFVALLLVRRRRTSRSRFQRER